MKQGESWARFENWSPQWKTFHCLCPETSPCCNWKPTRILPCPCYLLSPRRRASDSFSHAEGRVRPRGIILPMWLFHWIKIYTCTLRALLERRNPASYKFCVCAFQLHCSNYPTETVCQNFPRVSRYLIILNDRHFSFRVILFLHC